MAAMNSPGRAHSVSSFDSGALRAARADFAAVSRGAYPVTVDGALFSGLPDRELGVDELQAWLLDPQCSRATRDAVWAHLVVRARTEGAVWTAACVGLALPTLTRLARQLSRRFADDPSDLHAAVVAGFLSALAMIDLGAPEILARLRWAAYRGGHTALREALDAPPPLPDRRDPGESRQPSGHPDLVLTRAVADGVLTDREAGLISATRLGDATLTHVAAEQAVAYKTLHQTRRRAEARLAAWLGDETPTAHTRQSHAVTSRGDPARRRSRAGVSKTAPHSRVPHDEQRAVPRPTTGSRTAPARSRPVSSERS